MCYNASQLAEKIYKDAIRLGASAEELEILKLNIEEAKELESYHKAGFEYPMLHAFDKITGSLKLNFHQWGLIPDWVNAKSDSQESANRILLARGETIFNKSTFKNVALNSRCIVPLDGYFEHFHKFKKTFPYYITSKSKDRLFVAGLVSMWKSPDETEISTLSIVTTRATEELAKIHNNPAIKEARMPLILNEQDALIWLDSKEISHLSELIKPNTSIELETYTVNKLSGKNQIGKDEAVIKKKHYLELDEPLTLF